MSEEITREQSNRHLIAATTMPTGNPWLDDALFGGVARSNLLLVAARTGVGKTFFGVQLAHFAAKTGKNVLYFALEAEEYEIERRQLYYALIRLLHEHYPAAHRPEYREWLLGGFNSQIHALEKEALKTLALETATLKTEYRTEVYTPEAFQQDMIDLVATVSDQDKPQLVILDHLHHFFLNGDEIDALKVCIHSIKRLQAELEVPIVVLAQLRKGDGPSKAKRTLPFLEDIRGTASLTDVATDVLLISPVPDEQAEEFPEPVTMPMYFHLCKSRTAPKARQYAAVVSFDPKQGRFSPNYYLTKVRGWEDPELLDMGEIPIWAKGARKIRVANLGGVNYVKKGAIRRETKPNYD